MRVLLYLIKRISIELVCTNFMLKYSFDDYLNIKQIRMKAHLWPLQFELFLPVNKRRNENNIHTKVSQLLAEFSPIRLTCYYGLLAPRTPPMLIRKKRRPSYFRYPLQRVCKNKTAAFSPLNQRSVLICCHCSSSLCLNTGIFFSISYDKVGEFSETCAGWD